MQFAGVDIGSRSIEVVVIDDDKKIVTRQQADTGYDPMTRAKALIEQVSCDAMMATGYGRTLFEIDFDAPTVTEIKAHAAGAHFYYPQATTVLDIGGQDSKAISMFADGRVKKFEMNDRCAAGTGKFMEIMARNLGFEIEEFGGQALRFENELSISSMCTVFAESEVTSLIAKGHPPQDIAMGLHNSITRRVVGMIKRVSASGPIVFTGGVASNPCMQKLLGEKLDRQICAPEHPQFIGALGAALLARSNG